MTLSPTFFLSPRRKGREADDPVFPDVTQDTGVAARESEGGFVPRASCAAPPCLATLQEGGAEVQSGPRRGPLGQSPHGIRRVKQGGYVN